MSVYLMEFKSIADIEESFQCKVPEGAEILLAWYGGGAWEGTAFVLYRLDGKLYEVNGNHCSCFGLEDQWSPEETTVAALKMRELYTRSRALESYAGEAEASIAFRRIVDSLASPPLKAAIITEKKRLA